MPPKGGPPVERLAAALSSELPDDVAVLEAAPAPDGFHARFSATGRSYRYVLLNRPVRAPLRASRALWWPRPLDLSALQASAAVVVGRHDFTAFTPTETHHGSFCRDVREASWERRGDELHFTHHGRVVPAAHGADAGRDDARTGRRGAPDAADGPPAKRGRHDRAAVGALPRAGRVSDGRTTGDRLTPDTGKALATIDDVRYRVVLFDLDGTLIDSGPIILASMKHASLTVLGREADEEVVRAAIGGPGLIAQMRDLDPDRVDELVEVYRAHNEPLHESLESFVGMLELLPRLRDEGRTLGIVTAKRQLTIGLALDRFPVLRETTDVVIGAEDTERHKPDPDPLLEALRRLEADPGEAVYVGDSPFDVRAAKAAGIGAIAVGWGGIHPDDRLLAEEPDALVHTAEELHGLL